MDAIRGGVRRDWHSLPGRVAGSGLAGAAIGAAVAAIWNASWTSHLGCPSAKAPGSIDTGICFPADVWLLAIAGNCALIMAGVWCAFTVLRLRPRRVTVPGGCVVVVVMILASAGELGLRQFKTPPAPWVTALETGAGLAAFALAAGGRRASLAGVLALAVTIGAAMQVPPLVRQHDAADARLHDLAALGFPLEVPSVPGYHVSAANVSEGVLLVDIDPSAPRPGMSEITVVIGPASSAWAAGELALCAGPGRSRPLFDACSARGPRRWLLTNADPILGDAALAESAGLVMESTPNGGHVADSMLIAAATSLRPASAASLAGLPG
jgi:hypothetical protein